MIQGVGGQAAATPSASKGSDLDKLKAVAKQFESVFARQMLKSMHDAKLADDDVFGSDATDQFREMQDSNLADQFSSKGALGLGDLLVKQFQARVSKAPAAPGTGTTAAIGGTAPTIGTTPAAASDTPAASTKAPG